MKNLIKNIIDYLEVKNMRRFNEEKYFVKKLQPKATDIELNKCTHECFDKDTGECALCSYMLKFDIHDEEELYKSVKYLIERLETFKTIMYSCGSAKEIAAAKKYFDMIPLLKNIGSLNDICIDKFINSNQEVVDIDILTEQNKNVPEDTCTFLKALTLENECKENGEAN
jgi:hypothetical protein